MSHHETEEHPQHQQSDITSLQENFSKQQEKISALKELVRKSEAAHGKSTSSAQEKVKNIALRLTNLKSKARSRQNLDSSSTSLNDGQFQSQENLHLLQSQSSTTTDAGGGFLLTPHRPSSARIETPGSEKIILLRKQMEENKAKMAEREHSKREIEHMVTQLKAKFDTTQQCLEHSSELGRSMGDLSALSYSSTRDKVRSATDLASAPFNLDKERIKFLDNRVRLLEKQLEKEKSSSDSSKRVKELENKILELEEGLKEKRTRELVATLNDHDVEESWQIENDRLKTELEEKSRKILHLEEVNDILETAKCDLTEKTQELEAKLRESQENLQKLEAEIDKLNSTMDIQKFEMVDAVDVDRHVEQELTLQIQQLEMKINELEQENDILRQERNTLREESNDDEGECVDKSESLQATIESQLEAINNHLERIKTLEEELMEKTIELNVLNANFAVLEEKLKVPNRKPLFATMSDDDVDTIKDQLEEAKKKSKHLEKQLNDFKRMSDIHATVAELTEENEELQQKITELEDEKGQLQLKMVSGEHTTIVTEIEIEKKIEYLEATCQNQTSAIQLLEEQKIDMSENLQSTKSEFESARVVSEMESIQLEEQVTTNLQKIEDLQRENAGLSKTIDNLREEKSSLSKKMDDYVAENMELLDKIEKLSKSSSSAESIEIVERLTQQERLEIEAFNKRIEQEEAKLLSEEGAAGHPEMDQELSDSLVKLKEESSELMHKIELFTTERKEVLEKMETLTAENHEHLQKIAQLTEEKTVLERSIDEANAEKDTLKKKFESANEEKDTIRREIKEISAEKTKITAELNTMIKAASISVPGDAKDVLDKCEKSLAKLNTELESYRKANDKNAKFNASKKLSKEAKNAHQQLMELVEKVKSASSTPAVAPTDDVKIDELQSVIDDLRHELTNVTTASEEKDAQISRLNEEIASLRSMSEDFDRLINDKEMAHEKQVESLTRLRRELEGKIETFEAEMKILQDLIAEQKQQLIEAYTDSETELAKKMVELNNRNAEISQLKSDLQGMQANSGQVGKQFTADLQMEVEKLRESLSINKGLLAEQIDELSNKQETIDTMNDQIMELYKTMEENANKVIEKEDEIADNQAQLAANKSELEKLTKENEENKQVVDKLLLELHSQKGNLERLRLLPALEEEIQKLQKENEKLQEENQTLEENLQIAEVKTGQLEKSVKDLEHRNKDQLEKLKKYAANLKKKVVQCQEFEAKIKNLEKGVLDAEAKEKGPDIETLEKLERTTMELESMRESANQQRNHLQESVFKVEQALNGVQMEMLALREELQEKTTQVEELDALLNEKNQTIEVMQSQVAMMQEQINESNNTIHELNMRNQQQESSQNEIAGLQDLLNEKNSEINALNMKLQAAGDSEEDVGELRNQLFQRDEQINKLNELLSAAGASQESVKGLQDLLNEKNDKLSALNEEVLSAQSFQEELFTLREQLNEKNTAINELNMQVFALNEQNNQLTTIREEIHAKDKEIEKLNKILDTTDEQLNSLQEDLNQKNMQIQQLTEQCKQLQASTQSSAFEGEQLKEKDAKIEELTKEFKAKSIKFEKSKAVIKEKNREIQRLNQLLSKQVEEEQIVPTLAPAAVSAQPPPAEIEELRRENAKLREESAAERTNFQDTISRLETLHDGIQAKLQEDMSYIETLEQENNNFKVKICRLEECVATFEDRRASMERRANLLDAQLQTRTDEHAKAEDELVYRLNMLSDHDDIIGQRLFEAQEENELLSNRLDTLKTEHGTLVAKYAKLEKEFATYQEEAANNQEAENQSLRRQVTTLDAEMKRAKETYEANLAAKHSEIDELENDLSEQLRVISNEKRSLSEELERSKDELSELKDEHVRLNETINSLEQSKADLERESTWIKLQNENLSQDQFELQELRMQSMQDKTELENLKHQIDTLAQNHEIELNALRTQIAELDSMRMQVGQNQTDDQVFIETENKRLTDLLAEKESQIENYQRQNLQLQMNALAVRQQPLDAFAQSDDNQVANLREKCERLERELELFRVGQQVVVPPPVAFFGGEQSVPSVFDEIVSVRHVDSLHGAAHSLSVPMETEPGNQQTIEDLQRNVSDLEKHAQDLENKLAHRIAAHEDSLRQIEDIRRISEARFSEYEARINELELKQATSAIENQIIPAGPVPSLDMFFRGAAEPSPFESIIIPQVSTEPVVEEMIVPKKAYDCHPSEQLVLDEGWGWGSEEPILEAKHVPTTSTSLIPPQQQMEFKLQESQERIQELELERDRLEQQKQEMQVKSGKLMKKLKEYKTKIDELNSQAAFRKSSSVESSDLDIAIQEEMKSQLKQLEKKLVETKKQTDEHQKTIDDLKSGNERMAEIRERQDNDIRTYQIRIRELTENLRSLSEWGGEAPTAASVAAAAVPAPTTSIPAASEELEKTKRLLEKKVDELLSEIDDISGDRIELQAMLDEQKANVLQAENTIKGLQEKVTRLENSAGSESADQKFQLNDIKLQNQNLKAELTDAQEALAREKSERVEEINRLAKQNEELCAEIPKLQLDSAKANELEAILEQVSAEKNSMIKEIEALRMELTFAAPPVNASAELEQQLVQMSSNVDSVMMQNQDLGREVDRLNKESDDLRGEVNRVTIELQTVERKNQQLMQEISNLRLEQSFAAQRDNPSHAVVTQLETELRALSQENAELSKELSRLQLESAFSGKSDGNFIEMERLTGEVNRLTYELSSVNVRNEALNQEVEGLRQQSSSTEKLQGEVHRLTTENQSLTTQIGRLQLDTSTSPQLNDLEERIQEKDSEIMHLKQRIEDLMREDQTEKLVLEILTKNQEIHMLKMQVKNLEDDKHELEHNLTLQITQEMNTKRASDAADSTQKIQKLESELEALRAEKTHMEEELDVLNNHVMSSLQNEEKMKTFALELDTKNIEVAELRKSLHSFKSQDPPSLNAQWEAVIEQRCGEIATLWRQHLDTREAEFKEIQTKLEQEIESLKTDRSFSPQSNPDEDQSSASSSKDATHDGDAIQKMQQALESQELEIVTLKEQLAIRSAEYAQLAAQYDPYKMKSTMSHSSGFSSDNGQKRSTDITTNVVPQSELDLALYMLHQRDMRCEELTFELGHLLEERDTLQLKLSNTLRQMETFKTTQVAESTSLPPESPEKAQLPPAAVPPSTVADDLNQKLSQLHSVSHSKDKFVQEERDQRIRQMEKIQQDVAKMPSEALSELVGSDLSHSSQSPSSVLLNWLWGKPSGGGQS